MIEEKIQPWSPFPVFVSAGELCGVPFDVQVTTTPGEGEVTLKMEAVLPPMRWVDGNLEIYPAPLGPWPPVDVLATSGEKKSTKKQNE